MKQFSSEEGLRRINYKFDSASLLETSLEFVLNRCEPELNLPDKFGVHLLYQISAKFVE
jgi:hypothetical protein